MRVVLANVCTVSVLLALTLSARPATAQPTAPASQATVAAVVSPSVTAVSPDREREAFETYTTGRLQKWIGISLTLVGAVGIAMGAVALIPFDTKLDGGLVAAVIGLACIGVGIPLWVVGSARQSRAVRLGYRPVAVAPMVAPVRGGLTAGVRLLSF
jgi:hypothetical protein